MSKKGVSKVSGNISPVVGEKQVYYIAEWYADTPASDRSQALVTWELFKKRKNGQFTSTNIKKKGIGEFTFGETAWKHTYRLEAYLYKPEGGGLIITPKPSTVPKINKVELYYVDDTKGSTFSFMEKLRAKAYCVNLTGKEIVFTLWEDDAKGAGHHADNKPIEISSPIKVSKNGVAQVDFMLTKALMQKAMKGEADVRQIEFYVTAEYYKTKKHASENVNINNPFPKQQESQNTQHTKHTTVIKAKGSPAEQKPKSKKEEKGFIVAALEMVGELWDFSESKGTATKDKQPTAQKPTGNKPVVVDLPHENEKNETTCICKGKDNLFYWSDKLTCEQRKKVLKVCAELWGEKQKAQKASELMSIIHLETAGSFSPSKDNGIGYSGLIQFSDASAKSVGTTRTELKKMTFVRQMDYVKKYLEKKKSLLKTMTDLYLLIIKQNAVGHGGNPNYVLFDESIDVPDVPYDKNNLNKEPWVTKYGYTSNPTFMREKGEFENIRKFKSYSLGIINRRGFEGGKTYIWEVTDVLEKEHYNLGAGNIFSGKCENIIEEKTKGTEKRAPWIPIAFAEFEKYKGLKEIDSPLREKISDYFEISSAKGLKYDYSQPWCGAFIVWCFEQTEDYKNINNAKSAAAFGWKGTTWVKGESCEAFVGATIVFDFSHVAFIVGENNDGTRYIYLGGNQGNGEKRSGYQKICMGSVQKKSKTIIDITKPKSYTISLR